MARGRMISKSLGCSRKFARLRVEGAGVGLFAQALYPLLIAHSDDFGRQSGDAFTVKHSVWPTAPEDEAAFEAALTAMEAVGLIVRCDANNVAYLQIVNFDEHQQGLHKRTKSRFPEPPGHSAKFPALSGNSGAFPDVPGDSAHVKNRSENPSEEKGIEQKGKRTKHEPTATRERFERFWEAFPKHEGKEGAFDAWQSIDPDDDLAARITEGVARYVLTEAVQDAIAKGKPRFIKSAKNWLHDACWTDEGIPASAKASKPAGGPARCRHTPRCVDDAACTSRYLREMASAPAVAVEEAS